MQIIVYWLHVRCFTREGYFDGRTRQKGYLVLAVFGKVISGTSSLVEIESKHGFGVFVFAHLIPKTIISPFVRLVSQETKKNLLVSRHETNQLSAQQCTSARAGS